MLKLIVALFLVLAVNAQTPGSLYKFKSDTSLICRADYYGTFVLRKRTSGSYEELKFTTFLSSLKTELAKQNKEYLALKKANATTLVLAAKKKILDKINATIPEVKKCQSGSVKWTNTTPNFTVPCNVIGGTALKTSNGIVGGERCVEGVAPIAKIYSSINGTTVFCSGVLVKPNIVMTSAFCIKDATTMEVSINKSVRSVNRFVINPSYLNTTTPSENSLALIYLNRDVTEVTPATLYFGNTFANLETMIIGGYGKFDKAEKYQAGSEILRAGYMFLSKLTKGAVYSKYLGRESGLCADGGAPLFVLRDKQWKLAGIGYSGNGCLLDSTKVQTTFTRFGGSNTSFLSSYGIF